MKIRLRRYGLATTGGSGIVDVVAVAVTVAGTGVVVAVTITVANVVADVVIAGAVVMYVVVAVVVVVVAVVVAAVVVKCLLTIGKMAPQWGLVSPIQPPNPTTKNEGEADTSVL